MSIIDDVRWILSRVNKPEYEIRLNPPATLEQIKKFEDEIGIVIPDDYRELLLFADGQVHYDEIRPEFRSNQHLFFLSFASLEHARKAREIAIDSHIQVGRYEHPVGDNPFIPPGRVWLESWIPIGYDIYYRNLLFLETQPVNCKAESIIFCRGEETWCFKPIATTVTHLIRRVRESIDGFAIPSVFSIPPLDEAELRK